MATKLNPDALVYDVTGADHEEQEIRIRPKPGAYEAKIHSAEREAPEGKTPRTHVVYEITKGKYKGSRVHEYITDGIAWKLDEFLMAIGIDTKAKEKGKLSLKKAAVGKDVCILLVAGTGEYGAEFKKVYKWKELALDEVDDEDEEDDEDGDDDDSEDDEDEDSDGDGDDEDDEDGDEEDDEGEDGDEEDDDDDGGPDLDELDRTELKALIKEEELEVRVTKGMSDDDIRQAIANARDTDDDDGDDDEEDDEPEEKPATKKTSSKAKATGKKGTPEDAPDYDKWTPDQLKAELKERGLKTSGSQAALIVRLRAYDKEPF